MFALSGIKNQDFKTVCSSVDKLDKQPWHEIKEELVKEKHIDESAVNRLADFVNLRGMFWIPKFRTMSNI